VSVRRPCGRRTRYATGALLALLALLGCVTGAGADEMRYSLGSVQAEDFLTLEAGESSVTELYFYNIDGSLPTLLELEVLEAPAGWEVALSRPGAIDGAPSLSLMVTPSSPHPTPPACEAGRSAVHLGSLGYVVAEAVSVHVTSPDPLPSSEGVLRLRAVATWQVPGGTAPFPQERVFTYRLVSPLASAAVPAAAPAGEPGVGVAPLLLAACLAAGALTLLGRSMRKSGQVA
jgi:hypothetical protein